MLYFILFIINILASSAILYNIVEEGVNISYKNGILLILTFPVGTMVLIIFGFIYLIFLFFYNLLEGN